MSESLTFDRNKSSDEEMGNVARILVSELNLGDPIRVIVKTADGLYGEVMLTRDNVTPYEVSTSVHVFLNNLNDMYNPRWEVDMDIEYLSFIPKNLNNAIHVDSLKQLVLFLPELRAHDFGGIQGRFDELCEKLYDLDVDLIDLKKEA